MKYLFFAFIASAAIALPFVQDNADQLVLAGEETVRLIELDSQTRQLMSEDEIYLLIESGIHFMDVTEHANDVPIALLKDSVPPLPKDARLESVVTPLFKSLDKERMSAFLTKFSAFTNRYYNSHGLESAEFLFKTVSDIAAASSLNITVCKFEHSWKQFSIIARFDSADNDAHAVIVGAHQDSINARNRLEGRAPGADDDGSGTTSILEAFTVLAASNLKFVRPVEFHWYSGEEVGLLGSQAIASKYASDKRKVMGMIHNDMTGFVDEKSRRAGKPHFGIITDYTDPQLTTYMKLLISKYADMYAVETRCGYACSDHASWNKYGYRSAFAIEGQFSESNPFIHTTEDTVEKIDFTHVAEYSKLAISFAVELGMYSA